MCARGLITNSQHKSLARRYVKTRVLGLGLRYELLLGGPSSSHKILFLAPEQLILVSSRGSFDLKLAVGVSLVRDWLSKLLGWQVSSAGSPQVIRKRPQVPRDPLVQNNMAGWMVAKPLAKVYTRGWWCSFWNWRIRSWAHADALTGPRSSEMNRNSFFPGSVGLPNVKITVLCRVISKTNAQLNPI